MWWLSFRDGTAVIIEATSLAHARMLAAVHQIGRVAQFADGYLLSPDLAALIPNDCVDRLLSRDDAWRLYDRLQRQQPLKHAAAMNPASLRMRSGGRV
jgi:hypothetical protein